MDIDFHPTASSIIPSEAMNSWFHYSKVEIYVISHRKSARNHDYSLAKRFYTDLKSYILGKIRAKSCLRCKLSGRKLKNTVLSQGGEEFRKWDRVLQGN
jgi:hypothetical protein